MRKYNTKRSKYSYFVLFFSLLFQCLSAQEKLQEVLDKAGYLNDRNPQEKMYLHLDKHFYTAGETIWFKVYTTIGVDNLLSNWSGIAYVELIDPAKKVAASVTLPLTMGLGWGDFTLHDTITEGSYRLRAYTNWMRNEDEVYFYQRTLQISNGRSDKVLTRSEVLGEDEKNSFAVTLANLKGQPLAKTRLSYQIVRENGNTDNKLITTDENGQLRVSLNKKDVGSVLGLQFEYPENNIVNKQIKIPDTDLRKDVQLFAEGGKILNEKVNTIAVKSIDSKGMGLRAKVYILSSVDTAAVIETNSLGMGSSPVFVTIDSPYQAFAVFEDGSQMEVPFPSIETSGFSIVVDNLHSTKLQARLHASKDRINGSEVYFAVHHLGQIFSVGKQRLDKEEMMFVLDKEALPNGILTISLLDNNYMPVLERSFFNYQMHNRFFMSAKSDRERYGKRDKVKVFIEAGLPSDTLRIGMFSASVIHLSSIGEEYKYAPNIESTLLLNSDLQGFIEMPGYYFEGEKVKMRDIDNLLLTQGWRKLDWSRIGMDMQPRYEVEKSLKVSGYAHGSGSKGMERFAKISLFPRDNVMDIVETVADKSGYFELDSLIYPDTAQLLMHAKSPTGKGFVQITESKFEHAPVGQNRDHALERNDVNTAQADLIHHSEQYFSALERAGLMKKSTIIEPVLVRGHQRAKAAQHSQNIHGPGRADQVITAKDLENCGHIFGECLAGKLLGIVFRRMVVTNNGLMMEVFWPHNTRGNVPMEILLDGVRVQYHDLNWMVNMADIESIEVLRSSNLTAAYGSRGVNGVLLLTSKGGLYASEKHSVQKGIATVNRQGLHVAKTFYKPRYDTEYSSNIGTDLRTTIHWEPNLMTDNNGNTYFEFYTSDQAGSYLMVIEGIDLNGRIAQKLVEIEVK